MPKFWSNRTIDELRDAWFQMRQQGLLKDQQETSQSMKEKYHLKMIYFYFHILDNSTPMETSEGLL